MDIKFKNTAPITSGKNELLSDSGMKLLNFRIEQEEISSRLYLAMSTWLNNNGYTGSAALWKKYSDEEMTHANWARQYLLSMGVTPATPALDMPQQNFAGLPEIIQQTHDHEIKITKQCKQFATIIFKEGDHMMYQLALQYLKEQVEEHDKAQNLVDRLKAFGTDKIALRLLDNELGGLA